MAFRTACSMSSTAMPCLRADERMSTRQNRTTKQARRVPQTRRISKGSQRRPVPLACIRDVSNHLIHRGPGDDAASVTSRERPDQRHCMDAVGFSGRTESRFASRGSWVRVPSSPLFPSPQVQFRRRIDRSRGCGTNMRRDAVPMCDAAPDLDAAANATVAIHGVRSSGSASRARASVLRRRRGQP